MRYEYVMARRAGPQHHRRSIRLQEWDYSQAGAYFVTICTQNRECVFGNVVDGEMVLNDAGRVVESVWNDLPNHYPHVELDEFVIMPNHFHGIVVIIDDVIVRAIHELPLQHELPRQMTQKQRRNMLLPKLIGRFKMLSSKRINQLRKTPGARLWQRNYYEHIVRNEYEFNSICQYIIDNPAGWKEDELFIKG